LPTNVRISRVTTSVPGVPVAALRVPVVRNAYETGPGAPVVEATGVHVRVTGSGVNELMTKGVAAWETVVAPVGSPVGAGTAAVADAGGTPWGVVAESTLVLAAGDPSRSDIAAG
jgi:hypothetical protein